MDENTKTCLTHSADRLIVVRRSPNKYNPDQVQIHLIDLIMDHRVELKLMANEAAGLATLITQHLAEPVDLDEAIDEDSEDLD